MDRRRLLQSLGSGAAAWIASRAGFAAPPARFKLGITTDEVHADLETALKFLHEFGLGWAELRNVGKKYVTDLSLDEAREARKLLDRRRVQVSVLDTALYKCTLPGTKPARQVRDDYPYAEQDALLARALERAEIFGTRLVRIFSFWRVEDNETIFDRVVEHLARAAERARKADRILIVENVGNAVAQTGAEAARLLRAVPSPHLGMLWDPNNAYCGGERPFPDGYDALDKKRLHHVHLRDAARDASGRCQWLPVGKGEVDNLGLLRALVRAGFRGTLTLETHYQRPDRNKELASRESLEGLLEVIEKV